MRARAPASAPPLVERGGDTRPAHHVAAAIRRRAEEVVLVLQGTPGKAPFWALPDGVVSEARLVWLTEAVERLRRTSWLELVADYLEGRVEPRTLHFERWHADGSIDSAPEPPSYNL